MKYSLKTEQLEMLIAVTSLILMVVSASAFASCYTNARGRVVCNNGEQAGGYNANTGTAWKSERNSNGVATTQTSRGGEAKRPKTGRAFTRALAEKIATKAQTATTVTDPQGLWVLAIRNSFGRLATPSYGDEWRIGG